MEKTLKEYLAGECETVAAKMATESDVDRLYYFSAVFGAAQRVFNIEYSPQVLHLFVVANWTHSQLTARLQAEQGAHLMTPSMPKGMLEALTGIVREIAQRVREDQDFTDLLSEMCRVGYTSTGNGYYLLQVGKL